MTTRDWLYLVGEAAGLLVPLAAFALLWWIAAA